MRILVDVRHLSQGKLSGVGEYTVQLLRALFRIDRENEYVLLSSSLRAKRSNLVDLAGNEIASSPSAPRNDRITIIHRAIPNKLLNLSIRALNTPSLERLAGGTFDLQFLPNLNFVPLPPTTPTVLMVHDMSWQMFPEYYSKKMRAWHRLVRPHALIHASSAILTPSHATARDVVRLEELEATRVHVVPHGIGPEFTAHPAPTDHGVRSRYKLPKRFALFMGTLEPRKNVAALLQAFEAYRTESGDDLHLVLVGGWGWNARALKKQIAIGSPWLHHLGYIPAANRPALYRLAEMLVWPSIYEGFGLPVLEAMASGTPVITSATSSMPEITNGAALLVDPFDPADITASIRAIATDPALAHQLREAGLKRAQVFSWETAARQTLEVFKNTAK